MILAAPDIGELAAYYIDMLIVYESYAAFVGDGPQSFPAVLCLAVGNANHLTGNGDEPVTNLLIYPVDQSIACALNIRETADITFASP